MSLKKVSHSIECPAVFGSASDLSIKHLIERQATVKHFIKI